MTKETLKTIKDIAVYEATAGYEGSVGMVRTDYDNEYTYASSDDLREEAIKWIKSKELQCSEGDNHTKQWIKYFFDITDKQIKHGHRDSDYYICDDCNEEFPKAKPFVERICDGCINSNRWREVK